MAPKIISIDGNIGSGKSTCVNYLKEYSKKNNTGLVFLQEPVNEWKHIVDENSIDILTLFYGNQKKYSFSFQMMAYISRLALLKKAIKEHPDSIIITERCLHTDRNVFAKMLYDSKMINQIDYTIYNKWFNNFIEEVPISGIIYLKSNPEIAYGRILERNRDGEFISLDYLKSCNSYHDNWIATESNVLEIDVDKKLTNENKNAWIKLIIDFINNIYNL